MSRRPRWWLPPALVVVAGLALSACSSRGASLGTTSSPCFHALPAASETVGPGGHFLGVRLVPASRLVPRLPQATSLGKAKVCVVAYKGRYSAGQLSHSINDLSGEYAIVVVREDGSVVLATAVLSRLPLAFRHTI